MMGLLLLLQYWLAANRPAAVFHADVEFVVTSPLDRGPGSLREAILAASTAPARASIVIRAAKIVLQSPLPPLANPEGIVLVGAPGPAEIDAAQLDFGAVLDIAAPYSIVHNIKIGNAPGNGIVARAAGLRMTKLTLTDCDICIAVASGISDVVIEESRFERNRIGIWLEANNAAIVIRSNQFSSHRDAAVWAVPANISGMPLASKLEVSKNRFERDRLSVVLGNIPALVQDNQFTRAREVAVYLMGEGAIVRGNRITGGSGIGIYAHTTQGTVIQNNEIDHNSKMAVLVHSASNSVVENNNIYNNGYGIASVLGSRAQPNVVAHNLLLNQQLDGIILIGGSPVVRGNSMMSNQLAGLRILDYLPAEGIRVNSEPFLAANRSVSNKFNEPVRGEYTVKSPAKGQAKRDE
jgi:parallel beta-helix repeat protein